jgi:hypothetical protein
MFGRGLMCSTCKFYTSFCDLNSVFSHRLHMWKVVWFLRKKTANHLCVHIRRIPVIFNTLYTRQALVRHFLCQVSYWSAISARLGTCIRYIKCDANVAHLVLYLISIYFRLIKTSNKYLLIDYVLAKRVKMQRQLSI